MVEWFENMIEEAEKEGLQAKLEFDRLTADRALAAVAKIEAEMKRVETLADDEIKLIEHYRKSELERQEKKRAWILMNLEGFMRKHNEDTSDKSLRLPHGSIGLRKSRDRIEITKPDIFEKVADRLGLWRVSPAKKEVDLQAVSAYIRTNRVLAGVAVIPGAVNFHYSIHTNGSKNNGEESSETGNTI